MSKVTILTRPNRIVIASKGVQGAPGKDGVITPELEGLRDEAQQAAQDAAGSATIASDAAGAAVAAQGAAEDSAGQASASAALAEQSRLLGATIGFATKADMDASLAHPAGTLALVTSDATAANNGTYRKTGASGAGSWVKSADRVTGLEGRVSSVEESVEESLSYAEAAIEATGVVSTVKGEAGSVTIPSDAKETFAAVSLYGGTENVPNISGGTLAPSEVSAVQSRNADNEVIGSLTFSPPVMLRSSGAVRDSLSNGRLTRNVVRIVLDGSRTWQVRSAPDQETTLAVQTRSIIPELARGIDGGHEGYSDRFHFDWAYSQTDAEGLTVARDSSRLYLRINRSRLVTQDAAGVQSWLAENPTVVYASAANPTVEELAAGRIPVAPGGVVSAVSTVPPVVEASVVRAPAPYSMSENSLYFSVPRMSPGAPSTTEGMHEIYDQIEADHPEYVSSATLGTDALGNEIREYVFSEPTQPNDFGIVKPRIGLTSGIHGNEKGPAMGLWRVMRALSDVDGGSTLLAKLRASFDFYVIPVGCPSGWDAHLRNNHNNVNINRNFTTAWNSGAQNPGPSPASELETQIIESWMASRLFDYFLDCHWSGQGGSTLAWNVVPVGSTKEHEMRKAFADAMHLLGVKWPRRYSSFPAGLPFGLSTAYPALAQAQTQAASYGGAAMLLEMAGPITYAETSSVGPVTLTCAAEVIGNVVHAIGKLEGL